MLKELLPPNSFRLFHYQAPFNEIFGIFSDLPIIGKGQRLMEDVVCIRIQISASPGRVSKNHFKKHNSKRPDVAFCCIRLLPQKLRTHIQGCPTNQLHFLNTSHISLTRKSIIRDLISFSFIKGVFRFNIPMNIPEIDHHFESLQNLTKNIDGVFFFNFPTLFFHFFSKVSITKLKNHKSGSLSHMEVFERDEVLSFEGFH